MNWQKKACPERYNQTLEELLDMWKALLHKQENKWWELNFPGAVRRAQEEIFSGFLQSDVTDLLTATRSCPKPPPPPGPPPQLRFVDLPEVQEVELPVCTEIAEQMLFTRTFPLTLIGRKEELWAQDFHHHFRREGSSSVLN